MDVNVNFQVDNDNINEKIEVPSNASVKHSHSVLPNSNHKSSHHEREIKRTVTRTGPIRSTELGQTSAGQENLDNIRIMGSHKKPNHHSKSEDRNSQHSEPEHSAGSKVNNQPIRNSSQSNDSVETECCNNRSNCNVQPMISSTPMSRQQHLHSEFSTRWPPTPIRSSYVGRTTAGRWLYNGQNIYDPSEKPFYDHSPAGTPTIYTGTVGECTRWNYGNSPQNRSQQQSNQQYNSQDGRDWDVSVNVGIGLAESHRR